MNRFKLLIIGAGPSGVAAAAKLLENGFSDFRILEAENRIGGRVNTAIFANIPVELGAEWIHGEQGNVVYELASKYDLTDNSDPEELLYLARYFDSSGREVNKKICEVLCDAFYEAMNVEDLDVNNEAWNKSLGVYFEFRFQEIVQRLRKKINIDDNLCKKFLKTFENWQNSIDGSHSWYETSLSEHLEYFECDGNSVTKWKNNRYDTLFNLLTKKIPQSNKHLAVDENVFFNKEVCEVKWNRDSKMHVPDVEVICQDGSVYYADHVLITCSLGVLKEKAFEMFTPALPKEKMDCIQNLGFGTVNKIFLKFSHRWWENDSMKGFYFLWSDEERKNDSSGWLSGVICFHPINGQDSILRGWITGEAAQFMETLCNSELVEGFNYLLNKFLGSYYCLPTVEYCLTSKWYSNPHFRGSYSCRMMMTQKSNSWPSQLAEPICSVKGKPILLFGGEATHNHYFSTVHGAIETGHREAERLLSIFNGDFKGKTNFQVVIVGAGISGLAAAKTLIEGGISDVIILEAQSMPGGRIRSLQIEDHFLELGAQWIHGDKNEVFKICQENDLLTDEYSNEGEGFYLRENGERIDDAIIQEVDGIVRDILENCENYVLCQSKSDIPHSVGHELLIKFNEYLEKCDKDNEKIKSIKKELLDWHVRFQLIDNSCSDLRNLSAKAWGLFKFCGGNDYVNFKRGYTSLIDTLVNSLPKNTIVYDTCAKRIEWAEKIDKCEKGVSHFGSNPCVKILCSNGFKLSSQHVIVTSSLGYLKENYKTMFSPPLPKYLTEAIEHLDFGVIDKIFLIYKKSWWDAGAKGFQLLWTDKEDSATSKCWERYLTGFDVIFSGKPILLGWIGGEGAKMVEEMSEGEVGSKATEILRKFTRNPNIPLPEKVIKSEWWRNEYIKGGYSHITVKCEENEINGSNLARPIFSTVYSKQGNFKKPTVLLAGESTHKSYFSTVHGAYESGQNQAKVVLEHINARKD